MGELFSIEHPDDLKSGKRQSLVVTGKMNTRKEHAAFAAGCVRWKSSAMRKGDIRIFCRSLRPVLAVIKDSIDAMKAYAVITGKRQLERDLPWNPVKLWEARAAVCVHGLAPQYDQPPPHYRFMRCWADDRRREKIVTRSLGCKINTQPPPDESAQQLDFIQ